MRVHGWWVPFTLLLAAVPAAAQRHGWRFTPAPAAGVWFHGVALSAPPGFGALPLYGVSYRAELGTARSRLGLPPTVFERRGAELTPGLAVDSAFEVLHFLPLWFPTATPEELFGALDRVVRGGAEVVADLPPRLRFGAAAVAATLPLPSQRALLGRLVADLREEWATGYRSLHQSLLPPARLAEVDAAWRPLAIALGPYLRQHRLDGGLVLLSPALGPDGRLFSGRPGDPTDNVVAVRLTGSEPAEAAVFRLVRELCYPAVRAAWSDAGTDRRTGERLSGVAAVRCGHELLARYAPGRVAGYDAHWVADAGMAGAFTEVFALPEQMAAAVASRIAMP